MNQPTDNIRHLMPPEQALDQLVGEQFIEWLLEYVASQVRNWPELAQISSAKPKIEKIRKFMLQRYLAAQAFLGSKDGDPGFLGFAIANLSEVDDPLAESAVEILEKKRQEELTGQTKSELGFSAHKVTWEKLLTALGLTKEEISRAESKEPTRNYIAELSDLYSNSEWPTTVGAFTTHERAIPEEYTAIKNMIMGAVPLPESDLEVLTWHAGADYKYFLNSAHVIEKIVFDRENKDLVFEGVSRQLQIRKDFYGALAKYLEG